MTMLSFLRFDRPALWQLTLGSGVLRNTLFAVMAGILLFVPALVLAQAEQSSMSPSASPSPCVAKIGVLFENCIDPVWKRAVASSSEPDITASSSDVSWGIKRVSRVNNVIEVDFGKGAHGRFSIEAGALSDANTPHTWLDLTAFKQGELVFDLKVLNYGENINGFEVSLGCSNQCQSAPLGVYTGKPGEWHAIHIPVRDLMAEGLEISQVQTGFSIYPIEDEHRGVVIQLDNIRFTAPIPTPMGLVVL